MIMSPRVANPALSRLLVPMTRGNTRFPAPKNMQNMAKPAVRTVLVRLIKYYFS